MHGSIGVIWLPVTCCLLFVVHAGLALQSMPQDPPRLGESGKGCMCLRKRWHGARAMSLFASKVVRI
jgi:hypothetical protein